ncbi:hypothetical protein D9M68_597230 [compost metagenome]
MLEVVQHQADRRVRAGKVADERLPRVRRQRPLALCIAPAWRRVQKCLKCKAQGAQERRAIPPGLPQ